MDEMFVRWLMGDMFGVEGTTPDVPARMADAACAGHPTALWFAELGASHAAPRGPTVRSVRAQRSPRPPLRLDRWPAGRARPRSICRGRTCT